MRFCKDCIHYEKYNHLCQSPMNPVSRVTGEPKQQDPYKSRYDEGLCGEQGVFWVPGQRVRS